MSAIKVRTIDELPAIHHGSVKLAAAELGIESFGMQVLDFPPHFADYPEHDHTEDGQEEVYVILRGSAEFSVDGEQALLQTGQMARIPPEARRKLTPGPDGVRLLAVGCAIDRAYQRPAGFELQVQA